MEWLSPKAMLDSINDLEDALKKNDPYIVRKAAEAVVATRDQFFDAARNLVGAMIPKSD